MYYAIDNHMYLVREENKKHELKEQRKNIILKYHYQNLKDMTQKTYLPN